MQLANIILFIHQPLLFSFDKTLQEDFGARFKFEGRWDASNDTAQGIVHNATTQLTDWHIGYSAIT